MEKYKVYPDFNDVENAFLKAYNRIGIAINITEKHGPEECEKYLSQFIDADKALIHLCGQFIQKFGREAVAKQAHEAAGKLVGAADTGE